MNPATMCSFIYFWLERDLAKACIVIHGVNLDNTHIISLEFSIFLIFKSQNKTKQKGNSKHGSPFVCLIIQMLKNYNNTVMKDILIDQQADILCLSIRHYSCGFHLELVPL